MTAATHSLLRVTLTVSSVAKPEPEVLIIRLLVLLSGLEEVVTDASLLMSDVGRCSNVFSRCSLQWLCVLTSSTSCTRTHARTHTHTQLCYSSLETPSRRQIFCRYVWLVSSFNNYDMMTCLLLNVGLTLVIYNCTVGIDFRFKQTSRLITVTSIVSSVQRQLSLQRSCLFWQSFTWLRYASHVIGTTDGVAAALLWSVAGLSPSLDDSSTCTCIAQPPPDVVAEEFVISVLDVERKLSRVEEVHKTPGPDGLINWLPHDFSVISLVQCSAPCTTRQFAKDSVEGGERRAVQKYSCAELLNPTCDRFHSRPHSAWCSSLLLGRGFLNEWAIAWTTGSMATSNNGQLCTRWSTCYTTGTPASTRASLCARFS